MSRVTKHPPASWTLLPPYSQNPLSPPCKQAKQQPLPSFTLTSTHGIRASARNEEAAKVPPDLDQVAETTPGRGLSGTGAEALVPPRGWMRWPATG